MAVYMLFVLFWGHLLVLRQMCLYCVVAGAGERVVFAMMCLSMFSFVIVKKHRFCILKNLYTKPMFFTII